MLWVVEMTAWNSPVLSVIILIQILGILLWP
jgi:hypothetical protein